MFAFILPVFTAAVNANQKYFLSVFCIKEAVNFTRDLPALYETVSVQLKQDFEKLDYLFSRFPSGIRDAFDQIGENMGEYFSLVAQEIASPTVTIARNVARRIPGALVYSVVTILSSYLFIVEQDKIRERVKKIMPQSLSQYLVFMKSDVKRLIGGYFAAQFKIMFVVAAILMAGFLVLGVDYSLLFAILIALLDFLPVFGTGTVLIPWAIYFL